MLLMLLMFLARAALRRFFRARQVCLGLSPWTDPSSIIVFNPLQLLDSFDGLGKRGENLRRIFSRLPGVWCQPGDQKHRYLEGVLETLDNRALVGGESHVPAEATWKPGKCEKKRAIVSRRHRQRA